MQSFFREPCAGLEIAPRAIRIGAIISGRGDNGSITSATIDVPAGMVNEGFASQPFGDRAGLLELLRSGLGQVSSRRLRRAGLSLPDGLFRVQMLEFDDLPSGGKDRDRLVRWRLEKGSALDIAHTRFRYQVHARPERGYAVLACIAKEEVLAGYESLCADAGIELWSLAPSSLQVLNYYSPAFSPGNGSVFAFLWIIEGSYATVIMERGGPQFYRYKEFRAGRGGDLASRISRELDDSLHFYTHRDRQQSAEIEHLFLAGEPALVAPLAEELRRSGTLQVNVLDPAAVAGPQAAGLDLLAAAFGAGGSLC